MSCFQNKLFRFVSLALVGFSITASASPVTTTHQEEMKSNDGLGLRANKNAPVMGTIRGFCVIAPAQGLNSDSPCTNLMLILKDTDGSDVTRDRTSPQGEFSFPVEQGKLYRVASGSRFYESKNPLATAKAGDGIQVILIQK